MKDQRTYTERFDHQAPMGIRSGEPGETEHPFHGNPYTNVSSAGTPEAPDPKRERNSDDRPGPQLLDDDCYFG